MNLVALTGNIATDIELRQVGDTVVTSINLAVRDNFKKDTTHFIRVEAWGKTAELLNQYCAKGSKIGVEGSLKVDKFQDKEGNNREVVKVNANRIEFLNSKNDNQQHGNQPQRQDQMQQSTPSYYQQGQIGQPQNRAQSPNVQNNIDDGVLPF